jgi:hypothetical protein
MQSSLLALALANRFFQHPLVGVAPAISVSCETCFNHIEFMSKIQTNTLTICKWLGCINVFDGICTCNDLVKEGKNE